MVLSAGGTLSRGKVISRILNSPCAVRKLIVTDTRKKFVTSSVVINYHRANTVILYLDRRSFLKCFLSGSLGSGLACAAGAPTRRALLAEGRSFGVIIHSENQDLPPLLFVG